MSADNAPLLGASLLGNVFGASRGLKEGCDWLMAGVTSAL